MRMSRLKPICGIYKITNVKNGKIYIGQSYNVTLRWAYHVDELSKGRHINSEFLEDFQEMGIRVFVGEVLEKCVHNKEFLLERERFYISKYYQEGYSLYNVIDVGNGLRYHFVDNGGKRTVYDPRVHHDVTEE